MAIKQGRAVTWPLARHEELLAEARVIHEAANAARTARAARREARLHQATGAVTELPRRVVERTSPTTPPPSRLRQGDPWRSAARRMGTSLVAVGRRLEGLSEDPAGKLPYTVSAASNAAARPCDADDPCCRGND